MNTCENVREFLGESDWDEPARRRVAEVLEHLKACPECAAAAADFDRIRSILQTAAPGIPEGGWSAMEARLFDATAHRRLRWPSLSALATAALLLIAIGYGIGLATSNRTAATRSPSIAENRNTPGTSDSVAVYPQSDAAQDAKAFHEVSDVFEHRAAWLLVGDKTSDMGLSDQAMNGQQKVLLLRLTMLESGKTLSSADLAIVPGQSANLVVPGDGHKTLHYRISTTAEQPTRLTISTQLTSPRGAEVLAALATTLSVEPGQRLSAGNMVTSSGDYELQIAFANTQIDQDEQAPTN
jgi:hypothetical protein